MEPTVRLSQQRRHIKREKNTKLTRKPNNNNNNNTHTDTQKGDEFVSAN